MIYSGYVLDLCYEIGFLYNCYAYSLEILLHSMQEVSGSSPGTAYIILIVSCNTECENVSFIIWNEVDLF